MFTNSSVGVLTRAAEMGLCESRDRRAVGFWGEPGVWEAAEQDRFDMYLRAHASASSLLSTRYSWISAAADSAELLLTL